MDWPSFPRLAPLRQGSGPLWPFEAQASAGVSLWRQLINWAGEAVVNLGAALVILAVTLWLAKWAARFTQRGLDRLARHHGIDTTLELFVVAVVRNMVVVIGAAAMLQQLGVKATSIIAVLGAASLAIGLALQGALSNVAAGVMILVFHPFKVGDIVESSGRTGRVLALDLFTTELATLDNLKVVIPHGKIFGDVIVNHSFHPQRRADVSFRLPLSADLRAVMDGLRGRLDADPRVLKEPPPLIEVTSLAEAWVEIAVRPWAAREDYGPLKADVLLWARLLEDNPTAPAPPAPPPAEAAQQ